MNIVSSVCPEDWEQAKKDWKDYQRVFENHRRYQALFSEFQMFLVDHQISVISYEEFYLKSRQYWRLETMRGLSQRSTIPSEDFEIVTVALLSKPNAFVSTDKRLLSASASIEANLRWCDFIHLDDVRQYIDAHSEKN